MLVLPISMKWLKDIVYNGKEDEYREIKPYWTTRFKKVFQFNGEVPVADCVRQVAFRAGYNKTSPMITVTVSLSIGTGRSDWGAVGNKEYYKLHIISIDSIFGM